ncbi:MAG: PTS sugar transporter subunit IIA [Spirochaetes bacterium]|jgi:PTS system nitrogen regulatory IIA component|nr:PTS sugar transporter subunit IIA [Spirochaetota bacterium]
MNIVDALHTSCIKMNSTAKTRDEVLQEIAALAANTEPLSSVSEKKVYKTLLEREKIGSTGFGRSIALPHCALDKIDSFVVGILTTVQGVDFDSVDDEPVRVFFFIIGPLNQRNQHIRILSEISNVLKTESCFDEFLQAQDAEDLRRRFLSHLNVTKSDTASETAMMCQCIIHIQNEDYFDDILELLSSEVEGSLTVVDSANAGFYLNRMPLFSSYWTDNGKRFSRMLIAVIKKPALNDIIRRISMIVPDLQEQTGVLITVQDLIYTTGSIDF